MIITLTNFDHTYQSKQVFSKINLTIEPPEDRGCIFGLMGKSGSGKSTLLSSIADKRFRAKHSDPDSISFDPPDPTIGHLTQQPLIFEHLSVLENINYFKSIKRFQNCYDKVLVDDLIRDLDCTDFIDCNNVLELSGGERQRIALLRTLSIRPELLLLDEPCNSLDYDNRFHFMTSLRIAMEKAPFLAIYVTHSSWEALFVADKFLLLSKPINGDLPVEEIIQTNSIDDLRLRSSSIFKNLSEQVVSILPIEPANGYTFKVPKTEQSPKLLNSGMLLLLDHTNLACRSSGTDQYLIEWVTETTNHFIYRTSKSGYISIPKKPNDIPRPKGYLYIEGEAIFYPNDESGGFPVEIKTESDST